jgi:S-adenosylmethionine:tRNA ribosyltransferase-isomerase
VRPKIKIRDYTYILPEERIAKYPLEKRDDSKLLISSCDTIREDSFKNIINYLPSDSLMVFNNTKVVPARLLFKKPTGAIIEVFCLEPHSPEDYAVAFASTSSCSWNAVIGNAKRWKEGEINFLCDESHSEACALNLRAQLIEKKENNSSIVRFIWDTGISFSELLDICGRIPIPPYLKRDTEALDIIRYQTLYAKIKGSVAAPTAGLHFTDNVLAEIENKGIKRDNICLHVGAGTFVPVKSEFISEHKMHTEPFSITKSFISALLSYKSDPEKKIIAVGTTSMRSLESLYYIGINIIKTGQPGAVSQWAPYDEDYSYSVSESIEAILNYMEEKKCESLVARTGIIIVPSYKFKIVDILVTNFHQPQSTLLLLIAAFVGPSWREIYNYALENSFRFLSYGDSSLLFKK